MKIKIILLLIFVWGSQTYAQKNVLQRILHTDSCDITLHVKEIETKDQNNIECDSCWYYSLNLDNILVTQGGKGKKILQGDYEEKFKNGALKRRGEFYNGLKNGEWRTWDESGKLVSVEKYRKGVLDGKQLYYSEKAVVKIEYCRGKQVEKKKHSGCKDWLKRKKKESSSESSTSKVTDDAS